MTGCRKFSRRTAAALAGLGLAATLTFTSAGLAAAAGKAVPPTPKSGPAAGGTVVTGTVPYPEFVQTAATMDNSCAVTSTGDLVFWGGAALDFAGVPAGSAIWPPAVLTTSGSGAALPKFKACVPGMALDTSGNLWVWANTMDGGATIINPQPVQLTAGAGGVALPKFQKIGLALALDVNGNVWQWPDVSTGLPTKVSVPGVKFTDIEYDTLGGIVLALDSAGNLWEWGGGTLPTMLTQDESGGGLPQFKAIGVADGQEMAIDVNGGLWAWSAAPAQYLTDNSGGALPPFAKVSGNIAARYALDTAGAIWAWGSNGVGAVGVNEPVGTSHPDPTKLLVDTSGAALPKFTSLSMTGHDDEMGLAISDVGDIWAWGYDYGDYSWWNGSIVNRWIAPQMLLHLTPTVTKVTFGGVPGTNLVSNPDGTYTVDAPPGGCGPVDVVVYYDVVMQAYANDAPDTDMGVKQATYKKGFTYTGATCPSVDTGGSPVDVTPWMALVGVGMMVTAGLVLGVRRRVA